MGAQECTVFKLKLLVIFYYLPLAAAITPPGSDALLQRASIAIVIFSIVTALHQSISMRI